MAIFLTFLCGTLWGAFLALLAGFWLGRRIVDRFRREAAAAEQEAKDRADQDRANHLHQCYVAGNDAYPSRACPFDQGTVEAESWIAGWHSADSGTFIDGRQERNARRSRMNGTGMDGTVH